MASSCNGCFSGLTFPDFVQQRCCNPCCQTSGSVGGTSTTNPTCICTCTCTQQSGSVGGTSSNTGSSGNTCTCCRGCSCGSVGGTSTGCCRPCGCGCGCRPCGCGCGCSRSSG